MKIISSRENSLYRRENFMKSIPSPKYGEDNWVDIFDPRLFEIAKNAPIVKMHTYRSEPITTISFKYYNTTTLWWLIVMVNGFLIAEDIPLGYKLKIPSLSRLGDKLRPKQGSNNVGKVVRV